MIYLRNLTKTTGRIVVKAISNTPEDWGSVAAPATETDDFGLVTSPVTASYSYGTLVTNTGGNNNGGGGNTGGGGGGGGPIYFTATFDPTPGNYNGFGDAAINVTNRASVDWVVTLLGTVPGAGDPPVIYGTGSSTGTEVLFGIAPIAAYGGPHQATFSVQATDTALNQVFNWTFVLTREYIG